MQKLLLLSTVALLGLLLPKVEAQSNPTFGSGPVQIDLISIKAVYTANAINFQLNFSAPVAAPSTNSPNSVIGYIDLDTDQNPNTGLISLTQALGPGPNLALGDEYYIDLQSEEDHPGTVDVFNAVTTDLTGTTPVSYNGTNVNLNVPLVLLGNSNGLLNYAAIVGTSTEYTSELPTGSTPLTSVSATATVPESSTATLIIIGLLLLFGFAWKTISSRIKINR